MRVPAPNVTRLPASRAVRCHRNQLHQDRIGRGSIGAGVPGRTSFEQVQEVSFLGAEVCQFAAIAHGGPSILRHEQDGNSAAQQSSAGLRCATLSVESTGGTGRHASRRHSSRVVMDGLRKDLLAPSCLETSLRSG
jgi:hypothetical protein